MCIKMRMEEKKMCVCVYIYIHIHVCVCIYICIYIYIYRVDYSIVKIYLYTQHVWMELRNLLSESNQTKNNT